MITDDAISQALICEQLRSFANRLEDSIQFFGTLTQDGSLPKQTVQWFKKSAGCFPVGLERTGLTEDEAKTLLGRSDIKFFSIMDLFMCSYEWLEKMEAESPKILRVAEMAKASQGMTNPRVTVTSTHVRAVISLCSKISKEMSLVPASRLRKKGTIKARNAVVDTMRATLREAAVHIRIPFLFLIGLRSLLPILPVTENRQLKTYTAVLLLLKINEHHRLPVLLLVVVVHRYYRHTWGHHHGLSLLDVVNDPVLLVSQRPRLRMTFCMMWDPLSTAAKST
jgi:hypothetical protein